MGASLAVISCLGGMNELSSAECFPPSLSPWRLLFCAAVGLRGSSGILVLSSSRRCVSRLISQGRRASSGTLVHSSSRRLQDGVCILGILLIHLHAGVFRG